MSCPRCGQIPLHYEEDQQDEWCVYCKSEIDELRKIFMPPTDRVEGFNYE